MIIPSSSISQAPFYFPTMIPTTKSLYRDHTCTPKQSYQTITTTIIIIIIILHTNTAETRRNAPSLGRPVCTPNLL